MNSKDKTTELLQLMAKHHWSIEEVAAMLPIDGQPRKYLTVYAWTKNSQHAMIPEDCLEILKLRLKLDKCRDKLKEATDTRTARKIKVDANRRR